MSDKPVMIERAKTAPQCRLWDGRLAKAGTPVRVTVDQAADLMTREPDEWKVAAAAELALVNAEIKARENAAKKEAAKAAESPAADAGRE